MKHQPFEGWILSARRLTLAEQTELDQHLGTCPSCRALHVGVVRSEAVLRGGSPASPAPGFTARWKIHLARVQEERKRRLAWWIFGAITLAAIPVSLVLVLAFAGSSSALLSDVVLQAVRWWTWLRMTGEIGSALLSNLPAPAISVAVLGWLTLLAAAGALAVAWSSLMIRYSPQGGRT